VTEGPAEKERLTAKRKGKSHMTLRGEKRYRLLKVSRTRAGDGNQRRKGWNLRASSKTIVQKTRGKKLKKPQHRNARKFQEKKGKEEGEKIGKTKVKLKVDGLWDMGEGRKGKGKKVILPYAEGHKKTEEIRGKVGGMVSC